MSAQPGLPAYPWRSISRFGQWHVASLSEDAQDCTHILVVTNIARSYFLMVQHGPPTWWKPSARAIDGQVAVGWLRAIVTVGIRGS